MRLCGFGFAFSGNGQTIRRGILCKTDKGVDGDSGAGDPGRFAGSGTQHATVWAWAGLARRGGIYVQAWAEIGTVWLFGSS